MKIESSSAKKHAELMEVLQILQNCKSKFNHLSHSVMLVSHEDGLNNVPLVFGGSYPSVWRVRKIQRTFRCYR